MLDPRTTRKFLDLLTAFCVFFTPLLFFIQSHDQFELPKLTLLTILAIPFIALSWSENNKFQATPLSYSLFFLLAAQVLSTLPSVSLSWRNSLWGEYENFSGCSTLGVYLLWFWILNRRLTESKLARLFQLNSLAALLSSLYAVGQHFGLDFIRWNPESVNATREFASLGNPNFLSAYLAMSLPLFLTISLPASAGDRPAAPTNGSFWGALALSGFVCSLLGTTKGLSLIPSSQPEITGFLLRTLGLTLLSLAGLRFVLLRSWVSTGMGLLLLGFGLFSTASRGGFLGAVAGLGVWFFLQAQKKGPVPSVVNHILNAAKSHFGLLAASFVAALFFGHSFFNRLATSVLHAGQSLETSRLHIWRPALEMVRAHPLFGVGVDNFKTAFPFYSGIEFNLIDGMFTSSRTAHNELLQTAATTGLLGLAAYLGVLAAFGFLWWKCYRQADSSRRNFLAGILGAAVAYQVQNLFSFGVAAINFLWFLMLAAVQNFSRKSQAKPKAALEPGRYSFLRKTALLTTLLPLLCFPLPRLAADIAFGRGAAVSEFLKKPGPDKTPSDLAFYSDYGIHELQQSVSLFPFDVKYRLYLGLAYEQKAPLDKEHSKDWLGEALSCYQQAEEMSPANAYYYNDAGRVYSALGERDPTALTLAEQSYRMAVHWAPASPYFILNDAIALEKIGKERESRDQIASAFGLSPAFTSKVLSQMAFEAYRGGDKPTAFKRIDQAVEGNPSNPEALYCRGILYLSEKEKEKALADFEAVRKIGVTPEKNPSIQNLDQFLEQAKN